MRRPCSSFSFGKLLAVTVPLLLLALFLPLWLEGASETGLISTNLVQPAPGTVVSNMITLAATAQTADRQHAIKRIEFWATDSTGKTLLVGATNLFSAPTPPQNVRVEVK